MSAIKQFAFAVLVSMAAVACNGDNDRASREAAPGGTAGTTGTTDIAMGDRNFVKDMAADGQAEVALGEMAQQKAANQDVREFAAMMVRDHSRAGEELKSLAAKHNIQLSTELDDHAKDLRERLAKKSGAEFDRDYIKAMVDDHEQAVDDAKDKAEHSDNAEIKEWASKTLPTLQQHLERAKQIHDTLDKH